MARAARDPSAPARAAAGRFGNSHKREEKRNTMATKNPETPEIRGDTAGMKIKWDDSNMKSSYANVCNVTSTREEVVILFGMNQAWNRGQREVTIQLTDRIVISPYAAKRMSVLLNNVVKEYENRFGALNIDMAGGEAKK
jgi:hypothetical protein